MPSIDVYLYSDGDDISALSVEDVSAGLDGEELTVTELRQSEQGIFYVYMLDVSGSMPAGHFEAAKQSVLDAHARLRAQDMLALIYFGTDVTLLLEGGETRGEVEAAVSGLRNVQLDTRLYDAMAQLIDLVSATEDMRRIAVVISDGINATESGMTREELKEKLRVSGVSVNAMCLDTVQSEQLDSFREFIEGSGGQLKTFGANDAGTALGGLLDRLTGGWHLGLRAASNIADGQQKTLTISFGEFEPVSIPVKPEQWTPDNEAPELVSAVWDLASRVVTVVFSEPVDVADSAAAYSLTDEAGNAIAVGAPESADNVTWCLPVEGEFPEYGVVTLKGVGFFDISMERNALEDFSTAVFSRLRPAALPTPPPSAEPAEDGGFRLERSTIIIGIAAILAVAVAVAVIVVLSSRKSGKGSGRTGKKAAKKPREVSKPTKNTAKFMFIDKKDRDK